MPFSQGRLVNHNSKTDASLGNAGNPGFNVNRSLEAPCRPHSTQRGGGTGRRVVHRRCPATTRWDGLDQGIVEWRPSGAQRARRSLGDGVGVGATHRFPTPRQSHISLFKAVCVQALLTSCSGGDDEYVLVVQALGPWAPRRCSRFV